MLVCLPLLLPIAGWAEVRGTAVVTFTGTSTMHEFAGHTRPQPFTLQPDAENGWDAEIALPITALDTDNDWRDDNLQAMFDAAHFPAIVARFRGLDPDAMRNSRTLPFVLVIRDQSRDMVATLREWRERDGRLDLKADFTVSLREFGLTPPRALGFIEVGDTVRVAVHVVLREPDSPPER